MGIIIVPILTFAYGTQEAVGLILPLLLAGDLFAVIRFRKHTDWKKLGVLFPYVALGMIPGLYVLDSYKERLHLILGIIILALVIVELLRKKYKWDRMPEKWWFPVLFGGLAGFGTAVGHAAGPVMGIYLLSMGFEKNRFMGTRAWFFLFVNLAKLPVFIPRHILTAELFRTSFTALPFLLCGVLLGFYILPRLPQKAFNVLVLLLAAAGAVKMIFF